jgi:hypothetical protein
MMTFAVSLLCRKSFGFNVTMKSARPSSAHSQKGVSWVGLGLDQSCRFDQFSFFRQQVDDRSDERRANVETPEHGLVLVNDVSGDKPHEGIVLESSRESAWRSRSWGSRRP